MKKMSRRSLERTGLCVHAVDGCMKSVQRTAYWTVQGKKDCANYVWIYMSHDAFLFSFSLDISHDAFFIPFFT